MHRCADAVHKEALHVPVQRCNSTRRTVQAQRNSLANTEDQNRVNADNISITQSAPACMHCIRNLVAVSGHALQQRSWLQSAHTTRIWPQAGRVLGLALCHGAGMRSAVTRQRLPKKYRAQAQHTAHPLVKWQAVSIELTTPLCQGHFAALHDEL
jgi:hypothetical protein